MKNNIVRLSLIVALVVVLGLVSALAVSPAVAATIRTPFENYNINCTVLSQTMWVEDGILHIRNRVMEGVVLSDGPYHEGTGHMVANANIDLTTMYGSYWGTLDIQPDAYPDGHWVGSWALQVNEGKTGGIARMQGYGELNGLSAQSELTPLTPDELAGYAYLCGGQPISGANAVGFVMNPGGK